MALLNYIAPDIYVAIEHVLYNKNNRFIRFEINMYQDASKEVVIASKPFEVHGRSSCKKVQGTAVRPPEHIVDGELWIVAPEGEGAWENRDGMFTQFKENTWQFWMWAPHDYVYYVPTKTYCWFLNDDMVQVPSPIIYDSAWWDSWFAPNLVLDGESNLYRQCYLYLKTCPGFEHVQDC